MNKTLTRAVFTLALAASALFATQNNTVTHQSPCSGPDCAITNQSPCDEPNCIHKEGQDAKDDLNNGADDVKDDLNKDGDMKDDLNKGSDASAKDNLAAGIL